MATLYLAIYHSADPTPTWGRTTGWSGSPVYTDADASPETSGNYTFTPDSSGLTASTSYVWYAVWDDGTDTVGPVASGAFTTQSAGATIAAPTSASELAHVGVSGGMTAALGVAESTTELSAVALGFGRPMTVSDSTATSELVSVGLTGAVSLLVEQLAESTTELSAVALGFGRPMTVSDSTATSELVRVGVSGGMTAALGVAESTTELSAVALGFGTPMTVSDSTATSELVSVGLTGAVSLLVEQIASDAVLDPAPLAGTLELRVGDLTVDTLASTLKLFFPRMGADLLAKSVFVQINDIYTHLSKNDRSSATARY